MFGIIYSLASLLGFGISGANAAIETSQAKERGRARRRAGENPGNVYYDRKGIMRDLETGKFASIEKDRLTGDVWLRHGAPSVKVRNLSAEWREAFFEEKRENPEPGRTVVNDICLRHRPDPSQCWGAQWDNQYYCGTQWFKDLKTGDLYVIRRAETEDYHMRSSIYSSNEMVKDVDHRYSGEFYMNIRTRKLVRPTDDWIEENKHPTYGSSVPEDKIQQMITEWNQRIVDGTWNKTPFKPSDGASYWYQYYFNDLEGYSKRAHEEHKMMGNVQPVHLG